MHFRIQCECVRNYCNKYRGVRVIEAQRRWISKEKTENGEEEKTSEKTVTKSVCCICVSFVCISDSGSIPRYCLSHSLFGFCLWENFWKFEENNTQFGHGDWDLLHILIAQFFSYFSWYERSRLHIKCFTCKKIDVKKWAT